MTKPNTVQDLLASGLVSQRDLDRMACRLFRTAREMTTIIDGYVVTMPDFVELPDTCKQFIRKALVFSTVTNILERVEPSSEDIPVEAEIAAEKGFYGKDEPGHPQDR